MSRVTFSIVVPFYNTEKTIEACISSLVGQDYPKDKFEIIFVNNNSTDASCAIVARHPEVRLLHEGRQGAYAARNAGIIRAKGSFIVFTDADAQARRDWLGNIAAVLKKAECDLLLGWYTCPSPAPLLKVHGRYIAERTRRALEQRNALMLSGGAFNLIVKKEVLEKEDLFREIIRGADRSFILRCFNKGYRIGFDENIAVKRNDIHSLGVFLLKNFIYGCASARSIDSGFSLRQGLQYISFTVGFIRRNLSLGFMVLLPAFFYSTGYAAGKCKAIDPQGRLVSRVENL
ncbi:glycosyltransferase [Candidatus Omnitrophota bacterium]